MKTCEPPVNRYDTGKHRRGPGQRVSVADQLKSGVLDLPKLQHAMITLPALDRRGRSVALFKYSFEYLTSA